MKSELKSTLSLLSKNRIIWIILCIIAGVILICRGTDITDKSKSDEDDKNSAGIYYSEILEERLEDFLMTVDGIEKVKVFITVDGSNEYEYAQKGGDESYAVDYLIINNGNGEEAAIIREIYPQIRGVAVSCTDGEKAAVKERITTLLSAGLGISINKIKVVGNQ